MSSLEDLVGTMTLSDLARFANTSVEAIVALAVDKSTMPRSTDAPTNGAGVPHTGTRPQLRPDKVSRGGLRLDHVLATLAALGAPAKLDDVRTRTGGSVPQVRAALQKLAEAGKVDITGERRGTRYAVR